MNATHRIVPQFRGSAWDTPGRLRVRAPHLPRIGVFCPHEPTPWLVGSFARDSRGDNTMWWWSRQYETGDGWLLDLAQPTDDESLPDVTLLVGDDVLTGPSSPEQASRLRANFRLTCGHCRQPRKYRSATVQATLDRLWEAAQREISLDFLASAVARA